MPCCRGAITEQAQRHHGSLQIHPIPFDPACLQRRGDYQKGEALVGEGAADTAGLSANERVPGQTWMDIKIQNTLRRLGG